MRLIGRRASLLSMPCSLTDVYVPFCQEREERTEEEERETEKRASASLSLRKMVSLHGQWEQTYKRLETTRAVETCTSAAEPLSCHC